MHERNRRQLCRLAFFALCVVPTLATGSWAAYRVSPVYAAIEKSAWQQSLFERTGLTATVHQVEHPRGGSIVLRGIELSDPDGGQRVANIRQAEIANTPEGLVVLLSQPQIAHGEFLRLWDALHDRVLRGPVLESALQITSGELTVEFGHRAQTFTQVHCMVEPHDAGVRATFDFQLAGFEMPSPARLQIERNRQTVPPSTHWLVNTQTPIPCALFCDYLPAMNWLGPRCLFQGTASTIITRGDWTSEVSGRFLELDLDRATESFPHKLTGLANVSLQKAIIQQGVLQEVQGSVFGSGGGTVSPSLLISLAEQMHASVPHELARWRQPFIGYDALAFDFSLSAAGLTVEGRCSKATAGVIMNSAAGELFIADPQRAYPLVALVRSLSPSSQWQVPATDESKRLLSLLAFPGVQEPAAAIASPPRTRVRLE